MPTIPLLITPPVGNIGNYAEATEAPVTGQQVNAVAALIPTVTISTKGGLQNVTSKGTTAINLAATAPFTTADRTIEVDSIEVADSDSLASLFRSRTNTDVTNDAKYSPPMPGTVGKLPTDVSDLLTNGGLGSSPTYNMPFKPGSVLMDDYNNYNNEIKDKTTIATPQSSPVTSTPALRREIESVIPNGVITPAYEWDDLFHLNLSNESPDSETTSTTTLSYTGNVGTASNPTPHVMKLLNSLEKSRLELF